MNIYEIGQIISLFILLIFSSFFSASETALTSLSKIKIRNMVDNKVKGAYLVNKLIKNPNELLGSILVGNNIVNITASALATSLAIKYFGNAGVGIATTIMTILILVFGEITPKSLSVKNPEKVAIRVAKPISFISTCLNPIVSVLIYLTNFTIKVFGEKTESKKPFITEEELKTIVNVSQEEGVIEKKERQMIYNVFDFGDSQVKDVMVPRTNMIAAEISSSYEELVGILKKERFSRIPIYDNTLDNIVGILYIKDLIFFDKNSQKFNINDYMKKPYFTFEFNRITNLFDEMRKKRIHMAVVLDEYGGTSGIVTLEDLVEEIVGNIYDEYDKENDTIITISENEFLVLGSTKIEDINRIINTNIHSEEFDSIGGFLIGKFGRLPNSGDTLEYKGIKFYIENVKKNKIEKIKITI